MDGDLLRASFSSSGFERSWRCTATSTSSNSCKACHSNTAGLRLAELGRHKVRTQARRAADTCSGGIDCACACRGRGTHSAAAARARGDGARRHAITAGRVAPFPRSESPGRRRSRSAVAPGAGVSFAAFADYASPRPAPTEGPRRYYHHDQTGRTVWRHPAAEQPATPPAFAAAGASVPPAFAPGLECAPRSARATDD